MKRVLLLFILFGFFFNAHSQEKIVVGTITRGGDHGIGQDWYWSVSASEESAYICRDLMESLLKKKSGYIWRSDALMVYTGKTYEPYVVIINYKDKYGVGIGQTEAEALNRAKISIINIWRRWGLEINEVSNYKIELSKKYLD